MSCQTTKEENLEVHWEPDLLTWPRKRDGAVVEIEVGKGWTTYLGEEGKL